MEEVLGFKRKDAESPPGLENKCYIVYKLVPVVSVEELEKYCKEAEFEHKICGCGHKGNMVIIHNLLFWAKEQASKKQEK